MWDLEKCCKVINQIEMPGVQGTEYSCHLIKVITPPPNTVIPTTHMTNHVREQGEIHVYQKRVEE
jgi:hypothetical protein